MGADPAQLDLSASAGGAAADDAVQVVQIRATPNGIYDRSGGSMSALDLDGDDAADPTAVTAVAAHQLARLRLGGASRQPQPSRPPAALRPGHGVLRARVFGANAAASFTHSPGANVPTSRPRTGD